MKLTEISKLERLLNNLEKAGGADELLARLGEIDDLDKAGEDARRERDTANSERVEADNNLTAVRTQITQAVATLDSQNAQNEALSAKNVEAESELAAVQEKVKANADRIEFADDVQLLFSDISKIDPLHLMELAEMLRMIFRARLNPAAIYPVDYEGVRAKAVELLERALGKALVSREQYDKMLKRAGEMHDDLMLDKLGKIEREKAEYTAIKDAAERASLDKVLTAALSAEAKGFIVHHRCHKCGRLLAAVIAGAKYSIAECPFCGPTNPLATQAHPAPHV